MSHLMRYENRWNPFKEMEELQNRLASLINRNFGRVAVRGEADAEEALTFAQWAPLVDITEDEKEYVIKAELPEVKRDEVKVTLENGVLTISGERKLEKEKQSRRYHRVERSYGQFVRSFTLPEDAEGNQVAAEFKEGILLVRIAKSERARPRSIDVKVS